ncbi:MAG TPA: TIGR04282 family arsenosugar biosynthesis glycosyltransferase [Candidatus Acidoferrum sp.]|nr:TIGR04282 family arsenosugar biosynthesis glycosyltransferase [Candidatus Acidoferrum sp.]
MSAATTVAVAVMAKAPDAGGVKTRLCPPLSPREAAALARGFLRDRIAQVRALTGARPLIAYTPASERERFERLAPDFALIAQRGPDLGARMRSTLATLLAAGHPAAMAIGTDTPTLPTRVIQQAVDRLAAADVDVVLGPAEDGGYYLIGVRADHPTLFDDVPWSTREVLEVTLRRARVAGLRTVCLGAWFDVDTPDDLTRLRLALAESPHAAPATSRFLERHAACRLRREIRR